MFARDVPVVRSDRSICVVRVRACVGRDVRRIDATWLPLFERGPASWLDREWRWDALDDAGELAFAVQPEWAIVVDEVGPEATGDVLGVLVTTGPVDVVTAALDPAEVGEQPLLWLEYIAIAPTIRPDCPAPDRRPIVLKGLGRVLMARAIERSRALGCDGRIGLHAEGEVAFRTYAEQWRMRQLADARHPTGGTFPVFFGDADWARGF